MKHIEPLSANPEQLLKMLDAQLALQRARKKTSSQNRAVFLVSAILFIMTAAGASLILLEQIVTNRQERMQPGVAGARAALPAQKN